MIGYVYFAICKLTKHIKVGFSVQPSRRIQHLGQASAGGLERLFFVPGSMEDESWMHEALSARNTKGDWFKPMEEWGEDELALVESVREKNAVPRPDGWVKQKARVRARGRTPTTTSTTPRTKKASRPPVQAESLDQKADRLGLPAAYNHQDRIARRWCAHWEGWGNRGVDSRRFAEDIACESNDLTAAVAIYKGRPDDNIPIVLGPYHASLYYKRDFNDGTVERDIEDVENIKRWHVITYPHLYDEFGQIR